jgi:16S rRNA (uracil1498-N3)-methyltransferase
MKEVRYFYVPKAGELDELPQEEAQHAIRVLRLVEGDEIFLMDGEGVFFKAEVTLAQGKHCHYRITEKLPQEKGWKGHLHIAMAPTKMMERVEWMVEKATEIGVDEFSFPLCKFSERKQMRKDRVEKIVVSAVKQSRKPWIPVVNEMTPFMDIIKQHPKGFICHCYDEVPRTDFFEELKAMDIADNDEVLVLVGPEGDFSIEEVKAAVEAGYKSVSLGSARLRTETAALSAVMMMQLGARTN